MTRFSLYGNVNVILCRRILTKNDFGLMTVLGQRCYSKGY